MLWTFAERFSVARAPRMREMRRVPCVFTAQPWPAAVLFKLQFSDGLLVENGLRAHDDDPRVPVLVNRRGHERPVFQRRFSGTPFDCSFVLSVLLQTSGKRTSKSLRLAGNCNGRHRVIVLSARQHCPTD